MAELEKKLKTLEVSGLWSLQGWCQLVNMYAHDKVVSVRSLILNPFPSLKHPLCKCIDDKECALHPWCALNLGQGVQLCFQPFQHNTGLAFIVSSRLRGFFFGRFCGLLRLRSPLQ